MLGFPMLLLACTPSDETGPVVAECSSYHREDALGIRIETWTDVGAGGEALLRRRETSSHDGDWIATTTYRYAYDTEGRLLTERTEHVGIEPSQVGTALVVHGYDAEGRRIRSVHSDGGEAWLEERRTYEDGRLVRLDEVYLNGWADQWHETEWVDGRRVRETSWQAGLDVPLLETVWTYAAPAPSLDAEVTTFGPGDEEPWQRWVDRYDADGQLVERAYAAMGTQPAQTYWFRYHDGRRIAQLQQIGGDTELQTFAYDPHGRLHRVRRGPDDDLDGVHDAVEDEDLWMWMCR